MGNWRYKKHSPMYRIRKRDKSISLLLGAGFSAPMSYPIGDSLNKEILACTGNNFAFSPAGELCVSQDGTKPDFGCKNSYDFYFDFCKDTIHYYNDNIKEFDYEEFYDFLKDKSQNDNNLRKLFEKSNYNKSEFDNFERYLSQITDIIYPQVVSFYLKDKDGNSWYPNEPKALKPTFNGYTGFLNCVEQLLKAGYTINVYTLNHDLLFERLSNSEWIDNLLCDGFEEKNSPFFGKLADGTRHTLSRYTGVYDYKLRLYKLHGSIDYYRYYTKQGNASLIPECYIKSKWGIGTTEFYKKITDAGGATTQDENCTVNYHPDFLTGTTSKIERYKDPLLYKKLFKHFKKNLNDAEKLIIIGYGCKDFEINRHIRDEFGRTKPCYIIDPYAGDAIKDFAKGINANILPPNKNIENISMSDLN